VPARLRTAGGSAFLVRAADVDGPELFVWHAPLTGLHDKPDAIAPVACCVQPKSKGCAAGRYKAGKLLLVSYLCSHLA
jgi:hypothetical protein